MKVTRISIFVVVWLMATHAAFAKSSNIYKAAPQKSGKLGGSATGAKKNGPCINGTNIRPKR
jgi:hypothetical protein